MRIVYFFTFFLLFCASGLERPSGQSLDGISSFSPTSCSLVPYSGGAFDDFVKLGNVPLPQEQATQRQVMSHQMNGMSLLQQDSSLQQRQDLDFLDTIEDAALDTLLFADIDSANHNRSVFNDFMSQESDEPFLHVSSSSSSSGSIASSASVNSRASCGLLRVQRSKIVNVLEQHFEKSCASAISDAEACLKNLPSDLHAIFLEHLKDGDVRLLKALVAASSLSKTPTQDRLFGLLEHVIIPQNQSGSNGVQSVVSVSQQKVAHPSQDWVKVSSFVPFDQLCVGGASNVRAKRSSFDEELDVNHRKNLRFSSLEEDDNDYTTQKDLVSPEELLRHVESQTPHDFKIFQKSAKSTVVKVSASQKPKRIDNGKHRGEYKKTRCRNLLLNFKSINTNEHSIMVDCFGGKISVKDSRVQNILAKQTRQLVSEVMEELAIKGNVKSIPPRHK